MRTGLPDRLSLLKLLSAATCLAVLGCGKQGAPLPPLRMTPAVPMDLRVAQRGARIELAARAPRASVDGLRLPVLDMEFAWTVRSAQSVGAEQRRVVRAAPGEAVPMVIDPAPAPGATVEATVRARVERRVSRPAPMIRFDVRPAPEPPSELSVERVRAGVSVSWSTPAVVAAAPKQGAPAANPAETGARFWIYRRPETGAFGPPVNPEPAEKTGFLDTSAEAEGAVCYSVRRVAVADPVVESDATAEQCVPAGERRSPLPPRNLAAVAGSGGADLSWAPPADERAVGYRIYRMPANGIPERIGEAGPAARSYCDTKVAPGEILDYAVTALDRDGRESIPAKATATLREP
jgi:hypothetical protein